MAKFRTGKYGSPKVSITIRCIANDLPCDMEELNPDSFLISELTAISRVPGIYM